MVTRFTQNPIITTQDLRPSQSDWVVECVLNPGVFFFKEKIWLLLRVAERPPQKENIVSFPIFNDSGEYDIVEFDCHDPGLDLSDKRLVKYRGQTYLSTISHLRLMCSDDGRSFYEPQGIDACIFGKGPLETYGIEDCRVSFIEGLYHLTYTQVSQNGVGVGLMVTKDWVSFERKGMILPPHNKDCALFEETIHGKYVCFHRPSGIDLGGNFIWLASSPDLKHWGEHACILRTRPGMWDSARVGAGAAPIRTAEGWLEIYHGADEHNRYCLGAVLLDLDNPAQVLARSIEPLIQPETDYEKTGFFGNVIFSNGQIVREDEITLYYGASDEVICGCTLSVSEILSTLMVEA
jgi:predicted GH43/DUF377 family glycosyl hydrolase